MKVIRVRYTVQADFADQNEKNIKAVMEELRSLDNPDVAYTSYRLPDGKSFMHLVHYNDDAAQELPSSLASFQHFQKELKEHLEIPPKAEDITLVDSARPLF